MKPVTPNPLTTFEDLLNGLKVVEKDKQAYQLSLIIAKLQRKSRKISSKALNQFMYLTGGKNLNSFAKELNDGKVADSVKRALDCSEAFSVLDKDRTHRKRSVVIDDHEDEIVSHERGYGKASKPEDYIEAFRKFVLENLNEMNALKIVCTRPSELTRQTLKELKMELDRHDFTEKQLNTAWNEMTNEDIVADIIAFVRQQAIGSTLISHETRVKNAFAKLRQNHKFNKVQLDWLKRIEKVMLEEAVLDEQMFEQGAFKNNGGFKGIDRRFEGQLREVMIELNQYLYDDGGVVA